MEAPTRNSSAQVPLESSPKDRRIPLRFVQFTRNVPAPGMRSQVSQIETGAYRVDSGVDIQFPQVYLDPLTRTILVGSYEYPLEMVVFWERAKAAISKFERPALPDYTVGKRAIKDDSKD